MTREECTWWVNHLFNIAKELEWNKGHVDDAKEVETAQQMAIEALEQSQWIPCSERLPKEYAQYLVCFEDGKCYVYLLDDSDWARGLIEKENIVAWMPLPEPWKGGEK